jgi:hypothetical protein
MVMKVRRRSCRENATRTVNLYLADWADDDADDDKPVSVS